MTTKIIVSKYSAINGRNREGTRDYEGWKPWTASTTEWLEIDLGEDMDVVGAMVQDCTNEDAHVTQYELLYSSSDANYW